MLFCTRWKPPARPRRAPAGSRSISSPKPKMAQSLGAVPGLSEIAFARRIRVRCRLGRGLRARGRQLLPEAAGLGALHARQRDGGCSCAPGENAETIRRGLASGLIELANLRDASSVHVTFAPEDEWRLLGELGFLQRNDQQFHWENANYATFDDFLSAPRGAQAQGDQARAPRGALEPGIEVQWLTGTRFDRKRLGHVLRVLHGDRLAQMGPAVSDAPVLLADRRDHGRQGAAGDGEARRALSSRARSTSSAATRCTAATGARSSTTRSCTSSCATTRPLISRSRTSSRGSRPARRASTSSRAATCR